MRPVFVITDRPPRFSGVVPVGDLLAEQRGLGDGEAVVEVDREVHAATYRLAHLAHPVRREFQRLQWLIDRVVISPPIPARQAGPEPQVAPALADELLRLLDAGRAAEAGSGGGEAGD